MYFYFCPENVLDEVLDFARMEILLRDFNWSYCKDRGRWFAPDGWEWYLDDLDNGYW